jgi:hypothetical protein
MKKLLVLLTVLLLMSCCTSRSSQMLENRVSDKCVVLELHEHVSDNILLTSMKLKRLSDRVIISKVMQGKFLYSEGDTILVSFDKRFDY